MAMIKCPECKSEISDKADACPKCGYNLAAKRKKKQQSLRSCGCLVVLGTLFCIMIATCSQMGGGGDTASAESKPKELTEFDKYKKRVGRCVIGKHLATYPTNVLKENLVSPKSYEAEDTRCDFAKEGEPLNDTLTCIHKFTSKNKFGVDLLGSALLKLIPPSYEDALKMERCQIQIITIE